MQSINLNFKNFKKLFFVISILAIFNISAFAESGFEFLVNMQLGMGAGIPTKSMKDIGFKNDVGFDFSGGFQFGYLFQVKNNFDVSLLGELGYSISSYSITGKINISEQIAAELNKLGYVNIDISKLGMFNNISASFINYFYSIQVGLFPKFNIGNFAIGIGGGVKIPIFGMQYSKVLDYEYSVELHRSDIADLLNPPILGYIKTSFDYSFYLVDKNFINVGLYLGFDIMKEKSYEGQKGEYISTFNAGVVFGVKYGASVN